MCERKAGSAVQASDGFRVGFELSGSTSGTAPYLREPGKHRPIIPTMCGIAGFDRRGVDSGRAAECLRRELARRGPDAAGSHSVGAWELVQTRLAVIDLSTRVNYPMPNETRDVWLLFNGEIYNHGHLRVELERHGHCFSTACDAEVVVHGFEQWGAGVFQRLNGMWAVAIVDERSGDVLLARDALGIKPLVRTSSGRFAFGSDALALVAAGLASAEVDEGALDEFLAFHYVPGPLTGLRHVRQVEPGTYVRRRIDGHEFTARWAPEPFTSFRSTGSGVSLAEADFVIGSAVKRQLAADVDVGVFLSSGIDSALVLDYATKAGARPVALTLGFGGHGDYDEAAAAGRLAAHLGVRHEVERFREDFMSTIDAVGRAYDMPFGDPSAIATLPLARLARNHVTVALSGTGGDDLFAGYRRHRMYRFERLVRLVPQIPRRRLAALGAQRGSERSSVRAQARSYAVRLAEASLREPESSYLSVVGSSTSSAALSTLEWEADLDAARARVAWRHGFQGENDALDPLQAFELRTYLAGDLLVKEDRATMLHSLEGRVPLLDAEVTSLATRTRVSQRVTPWSGKRLLRQLARRNLPTGIAAARKRGFAVPLTALLAGEWKDQAQSWLSERASEFFDGPRVATGIEAGMPSLDVWALCALGAWEERLTDARLKAAATGASTK